LKILFLTPYFYPERGAPQTRLLDYSLQLTKLGHNVKILTTMPNYPRGVVFPEYKNKLFLKENYKGIEIYRICSYTSPKKGFIPRVLNQFTFALFSVIPGLFIKDIDLIFVESPPLFDGISGYIISKIKKIPFILNVADIWPMAAVQLRMLNNNMLIKISEKLEFFLYKKATKVLIVTKGLYHLLVERGVDEKKLEFIPNGVNIDFFKPAGDRKKFRKRLKFSDKFIVFFGGNHGLAQGLDVLVESARYLNDYPEIKIIMLGDGPLKSKLIDMSESLKLRNIEFRDTVTLDEMPAYFEAADVAVVTLKNVPLMYSWVPVKLYEAMAMEKPVITNLKGDAEEILMNSDAGLCVQPDNPQKLAEAIIELYKNKEKIPQMGERGRKFITNNYNRNLIVKQLLDVFENAV